MSFARHGPRLRFVLARHLFRETYKLARRRGGQVRAWFRLFFPGARFLPSRLPTTAGSSHPARELLPARWC